MENTKKVPVLRFPEFSGEWEEKELKDIAEINPKNELLPDEFIYIDLESVEKGILLKETTILKNEAPSRAQRLLKKEDVLFQMVRPYQRNNLFFDNDGNYVASTGYAQIRTCENARFLYQLLQLDGFVDEVMNRCTGTSYPAINSSGLATILVKVPTKSEQQKIADFLTQIDNKINQLSQKKQLLERYKKGVMQQIFNQEIRFTDDDGGEFPDWSFKKLGELTYKVDKKNKDSIKYPIYSINNKEGFLPQSDQFEGVDSHDRGYDISLYKIITKNTFAYNPARINVGSIGFSGELENIIVSSLYVCFKTKELLENSYLLHYLKSFDFNKSVIRNSEGGVREYLFFENFSKIKITLPSPEEQTKIANFLTALDEKIALVEKQLQGTKQYKKGLLQQLFV